MSKKRIVIWVKPDHNPEGWKSVWRVDGSLPIGP